MSDHLKRKRDDTGLHPTNSSVYVWAMVIAVMVIGAVAVVVK